MTVNFPVGDRVGCQEHQWSDWYWLDQQIVRHNLSEREQLQECHDASHLKDQLNQFERLKQVLIARSASATEIQKEISEHNINEMDKQIEYLSRRIATLEASSAPSLELVESAKPSGVLIEVVEPDDLTEDKQHKSLSQEEFRLRLHLEGKVERAFYEAGKALRELRDRQLYRSTHQTFEEYCRERFGFERRHSYR